MSIIDEVRRFNRFYTREIGLLNKFLPASDLSLPEARMLYELAKAEQPLTAAELIRHLSMDKAHVSRILGRWRARGLIRSRAAPDHGKRQLLMLTKKGRDTFRKMEAGTRAQMNELLKPLDAQTRQQIVRAMKEIHGALEMQPDRRMRLRSPMPGDVGWIIHRQAALYASEYGWDWTYEALIARILGEFIPTFDPDREDAWIAEVDGVIAGSIFLMKSDDPSVAKLRLLYVEPNLRGIGIGRRLVKTCIDRARALGYRTLTLWTNDVLVAARRIYEAAGFVLDKEERHRSFGKDLIGQTWSLDLRSQRTDRTS